MLTKDEIIALGVKYRSSLREFIEDFLSSYTKVKTPEFHYKIFDWLPSEQRLVIAAPRGFAKSTVISVFYPIWLSLFRIRKDICIISASEGLAIEWLRKIRGELETNPEIRWLYEQMYGFKEIRSEKWTENHIILSNGVNIRARGAGGQIRGFRPDCIVCDDLETDDSVESEEQRKKLKDWLFRACLNTLLPEGQFIVIGTVIHPLSVLNDLLNVDNGWKKEKFRAYKGKEQIKGNETWSELWSHEQLQQRKLEIGSFRFSSEYMNDPMSDESAPIQEKHIRYWTELPKQYSCVIAVDPAYSEDENADYKVASLVAIDQQMNRYLIQYVRTHIALGEFEDAIINLFLSYKPYITQVGIPSSGVEKGFFESFMKKCQMRNVFPPVVELKNSFTNANTGISTRNKKARIVAALQPLFEQGKYYIHGNHVEAREELLTIGSSRWDDVVDTMAYAENILTPVFYETGIKDLEIRETAISRGDSGYGEAY